MDAGRVGHELDGGPGTADAAACTPGVDTDGDSMTDCDELADSVPFTDPALFNGLHATIGERPEGSGNCSALDDYSEMTSRFASPANQADVYAGWEFDTTADSYADPSFGFQPPWDSAESGRFSLRLSGRIDLPAGVHCLSIDIGATGTDIISGRNGCGQIYVDRGSSAVAEVGYGAEADAATGCVTVSGDHGAELDVVFWYFNIFEPAILRVRQCAGAGCTPGQPIAATDVQARRP